MRFAIIIPIHNALEDLKLCIESVRERTHSEYELILVNDASGRETTDFILSYCKEFKAQYIKGSKNTPEGFSKAANAGIRAAASSTEYFCILNSDTRIGTPGWTDKIMAVGDMYPETGILTPLSNSATSQTITFPPDTDMETMTSVIEWATESTYPEIYLPNGFCYIIKKKVIQQIGLFDFNTFPHYGSEDDYSLMARHNGFIARVVDNVFIWHKGQASYGVSKKDTIVRQTVQRLLNKHGKEKTRELINNNDVGLKYIKQKVRDYYE